MLKQIKKFWLIAVSTLALSFAPSAVFAQSGPLIEAGNFVTIHDVSTDTPPGGWADSVSSNPGDVVEIRAVVHNIGGAAADNVEVIGHVPENLGVTHIFSVTIQPSYAGAVPFSDTATDTIADGSSQTFRYEPGHARIFGVTSVYNCPSGCSLTDDIGSIGINIGTVQAADTIQIAFKARMTNLVTPTPTPTGVAPTNTPTPTGVVPTNTPTPTPTGMIVPTATPTVPPIGGTQCAAGQIIINGACVSINQLFTFNNTSTNTNSNSATGGSSSSTSTATNTNTVNAVGGVPAVSAASSTQVAGVSQLPKTGLPLGAWALSGLLPTGLVLRRFGKRNQADTDDPNFIWQAREFLKDL